VPSRTAATGVPVAAEMPIPFQRMTVPLARPLERTRVLRTDRGPARAASCFEFEASGFQFVDEGGHTALVRLKLIDPCTGRLFPSSILLECRLVFDLDGTEFDDLAEAVLAERTEQRHPVLERFALFE
jgi:hypothetical protein